jgi:hypothetical protein
MSKEQFLAWREDLPDSGDQLPFLDTLAELRVLPGDLAPYRDLGYAIPMAAQLFSARTDPEELGAAIGGGEKPYDAARRFLGDS